MCRCRRPPLDVYGKIDLMTVQKVIPILRIFDHKKAIEFYIDWLGFKIDWEHNLKKTLQCICRYRLKE
ncbi:MAG: glyoxalase superfamily protein [Ginsengibacter sp.]